VQKLLQLAGHGAHGDVVPIEELPELSPQDLVAITKSGSVVHLPGTDGPTKLLGHVLSLLTLCIVQEPKHGVDSAESTWI
jgi:hypothetical protein